MSHAYDLQAAPKLEVLRVAQSQGVAFVLTDFDGPLQRTLECLICTATWRIFLDRFGQWPCGWWVCPNHQNHPAQAAEIGNPRPRNNRGLRRYGRR
jgi:hypothetical protein